MSIKCYIDAYGIRRAEVAPPYEMVGWLLESDVQGSIYHCKLLFATIEKVKTGVESEWSGTGNAYTITITHDKVSIVDEYSDPLERCEVPLNKFEKALTQWFEFIRVGQEELLEKIESTKDEAEMARIREQRLKRKLMAAKKRRARRTLKDSSEVGP